MDIMNVSPDVYTCNILVDSYIELGRLEDAKHLVEDMMQRGENPGVNVIIYSTLMAGCCLGGDGWSPDNAKCSKELVYILSPAKAILYNMS